MNRLQGRVTQKEGWRRGLGTELSIEPRIRRDFDEEFEKRDDLQPKLQELLDTWFHRYRHRWPDEARWGRDELIGELRRLLAAVCIRALDPDLVILDKFQRFKPLIEIRGEHRGPAAELAQSLFETKAHDGRPVPTLLLSATPYKLYTTDAEIEQEDHYEDFLATTRFLFCGRESDVDNLAQGLAQFATALKRATPNDRDSLQAAAGAKTEVENALRAVMARTERVAASNERDAMLNEPGARISLKPVDVRQYLSADALFDAVGDRDPMSFWKSAPYLVHFMRGYKLNERFDEALELSPSKVAAVVRSHSQSFLSAEKLHRWSELGPAHPKMRELVSDQLDRGVWRLLWVPPTLPYWPLEGPFRDKTGVTKTLLFFAWNVVPDVVSAVLSYEAERRMTGGRIRAYLDPARQQVPLRRLTQSAARIRSRHRLLLLLLPCPSRPFLLTSTSIGQEGLDFHLWCHRLVHWNLPGNPVDLEQREGRVHRYKGHAVRCNVAAAHGEAVFESWELGDVLWTLIFDRAVRAAREARDSDLVPHWIASGDCRVERHVPLLPYTKEVEAFQRLKRQLAAYRVVFGQPRQEELIALLEQADFSVDQLRELTIDLSPLDAAIGRSP